MNREERNPMLSDTEINRMLFEAYKPDNVVRRRSGFFELKGTSIPWSPATSVDDGLGLRPGKEIVSLSVGVTNVAGIYRFGAEPFRAEAETPARALALALLAAKGVKVEELDRIAEEGE